MTFGFFGDSIGRELRHAVRSLVRSPLYTMGAVASLGIAIVATVTAFAVMRDIVLRPPAWLEPDEVVLVRRVDPGRREVARTWSVPRFEDLRSAASGTVAAASFAVRTTTLSWAASDSGVRAEAEFVSPGYMSLVGRPATRGRTIDSSSHDPGTVVLSTRLAHRLFPESDPVGELLRVNGVPLTIIGTMPDDYSGLSGRAELWVPQEAAPQVWGSPQALGQLTWAFEVALRIPADWSEERRSVLTARLERALGSAGSMVAAGQSPGGGAGGPTRSASRLSLVSARAQLVEPNAGRLLWILFGAACCVLLLACANVSSLSAVRLSSRRTEIAVRRAIGAPAWRLVQSPLLEASLIAAASASAGLLLAGVTSPLLWARRPLAIAGLARQPVAAPSIAELPALAFAGAITLIVIVLIGAWPALEVAMASGRASRSLGMRAWLQRSTGGRTRRFHAALSSAQLAIAFVLASCALLFVASLRTMVALDHGFTPGQLLTARVDLPRTRYDAAAARDLLERFAEAMVGIPGVIDAAVSNSAPLDASNLTTPGAIDFALPIGAGGRGTSFEYHSVSDGYFRALSVGTAGRPFEPLDAGDAGDAVPVIVNRAAVRRYWPNTNPIGQPVQDFLLANLAGRWTRGVIAGVVPDVQYGRPGATAEPALYVRASDDPPVRVAVLIRTSGDPVRVAPIVRARLRALDPRLVLYGVTSMDQRVREVTSGTRFGALVLGGYASVAVAIALIGVYSVMAFAIVQRRGEIAVRMALGAAPLSVLATVLGSSLRLSLAGLGVGMLASLSLQQLLRAHLFGVNAGELRYYAVVLVSLGAAGVGATLFPALAATRLDPASVLKSDG